VVVNHYWNKPSLDGAVRETYGETVLGNKERLIQAVAGTKVLELPRISVDAHRLRRAPASRSGHAFGELEAAAARFVHKQLSRHRQFQRD